mgnify:CR=1 FL=1
MTPRTACCLLPGSKCGTRYDALRAWVCKWTGKGVKLVSLTGDEQGKTPFFAQPVGFDGRCFYVALDMGCDTEKLLHEACHFFLAPKERRNLVNYGHGPGPFKKIDNEESDNEEVAVSLLEEALAPYFQLSPARMNLPDYNVANKRHLDWDACRATAEEAFERLKPTLAELQAPGVAARKAH